MSGLNLLPAPKSCRARMAVTLVSAAVLASGCAQWPASSPLPEPKTAQAFAAQASFDRTARADWPTEQWWRTYGDRQLDALIAEALQDAPDMAAARARLQRAEAFTQLASSALQPQLSANASITSDKLSENHLLPPSRATGSWNDYGRATLDFRWELDFWGQHRAGLSAATSELEAQRAELAQARLMLASGIASAYAELSRLYAVRELAEQAIAIRRQTAELLARRQAHGLETRGSLRAADAALAATQGQLLAVDEHIALQRNRLAAWLGQGPDRGLSLQPPQLQLDKTFGLPHPLAADLLGRRPDVTAARLLAQAQSSRIEQRKAEFYPNVNLSAFIGVQSLGLDMLSRSGSGMGSVGPAISLPLFSGGRLQGELRGAQAAYAESVARYNATVAHALQEVADAAVSLQALERRLGKTQEAVDAASEAHRVSRNRYEGGLATYLEVLAAEDTLLQSLTQQTQLRAQSLLLDVALNRALGGGYLSVPAPAALAQSTASHTSAAPERPAQR